MKKILFLLAMLVSVTAFADKKTPAQKAKEKTDEMQKDLGLSADQNRRIYDINIKTYTAIADYEAKKPSKNLRKKQKDIATDLRKAEFKKILTAAQFKKYEELKKQEKEQEKAEKKELEKMKTGKK